MQLTWLASFMRIELEQSFILSYGSSLSLENSASYDVFKLFQNHH